MVDVGGTGFQTLVILLVALGSAVGWVLERYVVRRRRLSYRVHWNRPVDLTPPVTHEMDLKIIRGGQVVDRPSFVVLRVENVGSFDVGVDDMVEPLSWSFGGRRIVHYEIQETDPAELADEILRPGGGAGPELIDYHRGDPDEVPGGVLRLPPFAMGRKSRFKLLVLLSGQGTKVSVRGRLSGGGIVAESRRGPGSRWGLVLGVVALVSTGALVALFVTRGPGSPAEQVACPDPGRLSISGSTVLYPVISEVAAQYMKSCPGAQIQVSDRGTNSAIQQLIQGGKADQQTNSTEASRVKLAMADDYPGKALQDPRLGYWPVGIGAFVIVVNKDAGIARLSTRQVQELFDGRLPKWNSTDLAGADQEVVLVSRTIDSGTRDTFVHRVLGHDERAPVSSSDCLSRDIPGYQAQVMHCQVDNTQEMLRKVAATPGAIGYANAGEAAAITDGSLRVVPIDGYYPTKEAVANGRYRFWAVERLYRYGRQMPPTVRDHFVQYLLSQRSALDALATHGFFFCSDSAFSDGDAANACIQQDAPTPTHS